MTVLPGAPVFATPAARPTDESLAAELRAWRSARCRADGVPAYVIAPDTLLAALVDQRPASIAALRRVKGMGPARLDRHGEELLAILARY